VYVQKSISSLLRQARAAVVPIGIRHEAEVAWVPDAGGRVYGAMAHWPTGGLGSGVHGGLGVAIIVLAGDPSFQLWSASLQR